MNQQQPSKLSSRWISEFEKHIFRGKHVLLYGNVHDQFLWRERYLTAPQFVEEFFLEKRFDIIVRYDAIDGFRFASPGMERRFNELVRSALGESSSGEMGQGTTPQQGDLGAGAAEAEAEAAAAASTDPTQPPPRRTPGSRRAAAEGRRIEPQDAFGRIRHVLSQNEISVAAVVNLGDMLTGDAARYTEGERGALMILLKAILEASVIQRGPLAGYRNTLVITAGELSRVPEWLYRDNPFVSIVKAARPEREERELYARSFLKNFYGGENLPAEEFEEHVETFSDLTDGFQAWDLEALRRTSWVENLPVSNMRQLIDFFKFGLRDDPWEELSREKVSRAQEILSSRVIGQPYAVDAVCRMLTTARVGIDIAGSTGLSAKPKGMFFFVGPTGVGKTELAKAVTELVFGDERAFARFDMSEYKEEHAAEKLAGAPPGFVGYEEGGQLTNRMFERPHSILLFDEIEKAHPRVLDKFLQILEDGRLTDGQGKTAYFNQAAIIFTSNIGASALYDMARHSQEPLSFEQVAEFFQEQVRDFFANKIQRAEIYNRLGDNIVPFDMLRPDYVTKIGEKFLKMLAANALERHGLSLSFDESVRAHVRKQMEKGDNLLLGGRRIKTLTESLVLHPLNRWVFEKLTSTQGVSLSLSINDEGKLEVEQVGQSSA